MLPSTTRLLLQVSVAICGQESWQGHPAVDTLAGPVASLGGQELAGSVTHH